MSEIVLFGNWEAGWAIELHTTKSTLLDDGSFDNTYTKTGEALNKLKYHNDYSQITTLSEIATDFLKTRIVTPYIDVIIPAPPSNYDREKQPVFEIAKNISRTLNIPLDEEYIEKIKDTNQLKSIENKKERNNILSGAFGVQDLRYKNKKILLFDDLYRSGSTLKEITKILYNAEVNNVYVMALTKTRTKK